MVLICSTSPQTVQNENITEQKWLMALDTKQAVNLKPVRKAAENDAKCQKIRKITSPLESDSSDVIATNRQERRRVYELVLNLFSCSMVSLFGRGFFTSVSVCFRAVLSNDSIFFTVFS